LVWVRQEEGGGGEDVKMSVRASRTAQERKEKRGAFDVGKGPLQLSPEGEKRKWVTDPKCSTRQKGNLPQEKKKRSPDQKKGKKGETSEIFCVVIQPGGVTRREPFCEVE